MRQASPPDSHGRGPRFIAIQCIFLWKENIIYMETSQPRQVGSPIEEARSPFNPISARGGGVESTPPGFSLAIATKINRSTPNFLTFNFYYRDII